MSFSVDISRFVALANARVDIVIRKVSLDIFRRVILKSPVDTGRFKGNWQAAIGNVPQGVLELEDKSPNGTAGTATMSRLDASIAGVKGGDVIYFVNNLPYAERLEYGWSKQAPNGVLIASILEWDAVVNKATAETARANAAGVAAISKELGI